MKIRNPFTPILAALKGEKMPDSKTLQDSQLDQLPDYTQGNAVASRVIPKARALDPFQIKMAFEQADQGYLREQQAIFSVMEENDAHLLAEMQKRKQAVALLDWEVTPPKGAQGEFQGRLPRLRFRLRSG